MRDEVAEAIAKLRDCIPGCSWTASGMVINDGINRLQSAIENEPHDGFWAAKQALAGKKMHKGSWQNKREHLIAEGDAFYLITKDQRLMWELSPIELRATDWRIWEEHPEKKTTLDVIEERIDNNNHGSALIHIACRIDRIEQRLEKLEGKS